MGRVERKPDRAAELVKIRRERTEKPQRVLPLIKEIALRQSGPDPERNPAVIHPSEMAKSDWCIRATFWRIAGRKEPARKFNFVLETIFAEGNGIHSKFQTWLRETGKLWGDWVCLSCGQKFTGYSRELPVAYPECVDCLCSMDHHSICTHEHLKRPHVWDYREVRLAPLGSLVQGQADGAIEDGPLVECKSIGIGTVRNEAGSMLKRYYNEDAKLYDLNLFWKELRRPFPSHIRQAVVYLYLAELCGLPYDEITFIYEFKPNQQVREYTIRLTDSIRETVLQPLLDKARKIENALQYNQPPPCTEGGCSQCRAFEEDDEHSAERPQHAAKRSVGSRSGRGREVAAADATAAEDRASRAARRPDRPVRRRADESVQADEPVGRISRRSASGGVHRRAVEREAGRPAGGIRRRSQLPRDDD